MKKLFSKSYLSKAGNVLFFGGLLVLLFNTDAKSWLLQQLVGVGLFQAEIKKEAPAKNTLPEALSFSFYDASGTLTSTRDLNGKVVFINFWASWCPPCRAEMPSLDALYNKFKNDDRFVFLFINEDEDGAKANTYLQSKGFKIPIHTRAGAVPEQLYSGTLPTTIVLNKEGKVVMKHEGLAGYNTSEFIQQLKSLL